MTFKQKLKIFLGAVLIAMFVTACNTTKCDVCEKKGADNKVRAVTEWILCDDCYYNILIEISDSDNDSYNNNYSDSKTNKYSSGSCIDCGVSIDSDRLYCDRCLGYGVCQDCGISIDSDRLYCDRCLGYGVCQDCGISIDSDRLYCDKCLGYGVCQDCGREIASNRLYCNTCLYK